MFVQPAEYLLCISKGQPLQNNNMNKADTVPASIGLTVWQEGSLFLDDEQLQQRDDAMSARKSTACVSTRAGGLL